MDNKKTIYIHIGMPKTGTTSIQHFLFTNRKLLEKYGVFYPVLDIIEKLNNPCLPNVRPVMFYSLKREYLRPSEDIINFFYLKGSNVYSKFKRRFKKLFLEKIQQTSAQKIIFSDEIFSDGFFCISDFIDVIKEFNFDVKVILYLKDPILFLSSFWTEEMKHQEFNEPLIDFIENQHSWLERILECALSLSNKIGSDNLIIRPFEKEQWKNQNLIDDFMSIFDISIDENFIKFDADNVSFKRNTTELLYIIKKLDKNFNFLSLKNIPSSDISIIDTISYDYMKQLYERTNSQFKELANKYGKETFFKNNILENAKKFSTEYNEFSITIEQLKLLHSELDKNNKEKENLKNKISYLKTENKQLEEKISILEKQNRKRFKFFS